MLSIAVWLAALDEMVASEITFYLFQLELKLVKCANDRKCMRQ